MTKRNRAKLVKLWSRWCTQVSAQPTERLSYNWMVSTIVGPLYLHMDPLGSPAIFGRFDDVEAACSKLNPHKSFGMGLNPYSGKWNHHYPDDWSPEDIMGDFARVVSALLPERTDQ